MRRLGLIGNLLTLTLVAACGSSDISAAGVSVIAPTRAVVSESGDTNTVDVVLTAQPSATVVIPVSVSNEVEAALDVTELVFTVANWDQRQTITLTGLPDATDTSFEDPPDSFTLDFGRLESDDDSYDGLELDPIEFANLDNVVAWQLLDTDTGLPPDGLALMEGGAPASFSIELLDEPFADVVIGLALYDTVDGQVDLGDGNLSFEDPATGPNVHLLTLTFTPDNYDTPQTFSVYSMSDGGVQDPNKWFNLSAASSGDLAYQALFARLKDNEELPLAIANLDPDSAEVVQTPPVVNICEGFSGSVYLQLSSAASSDVDVTFGSLPFGITIEQPSGPIGMAQQGYLINVPDGSVPGDRSITATMTVSTADPRYLINYGAGNETREFTIHVTDVPDETEVPGNVLVPLCPRF